jgi:hypothetical protein
LKSVEDDNMEKMKKWVDKCEKANKAQNTKENIAQYDPGLEYAKRKLEMKTLRKGINRTLYRAV